jgi:hypothetical protein
MAATTPASCETTETPRWRTRQLAAEDAKISNKQVSARIKIVMRESADWLITETFDGEAWIHRSYMKK